MTIKTAQEEKEFLEYQFFLALHNLKAVAPDHYLVTTIEIALQSKPQPGDLPSLARRQAE